MNPAPYQKKIYVCMLRIIITIALPMNFDEV
jgi:hypothetical protein